MKPNRHRWFLVAVIMSLSVIGLYGLFHWAEAQWRIAKHIDEPLLQVLPQADPVEIVYIRDNRVWQDVYQGHYYGSRMRGVSVKMLSEFNSSGNDLEMLHLLRRSDHFHTVPSSTQYRGFVILLWGGNEKSAPPHPYVYIPETGEIGRQHEWCYTPSKFQEWVKTLTIPDYTPPMSGESAPIVVTSPLKTPHR